MVYHGSGLLIIMNILNSNSKHYLQLLYSVLFSMWNDRAVFVMKCPSHFSNQTICLSKCLLKFIPNKISQIWIQSWQFFRVYNSYWLVANYLLAVTNKSTEQLAKNKVPYIQILHVVVGINFRRTLELKCQHQFISGNTLIE